MNDSLSDPTASDPRAPAPDAAAVLLLDVSGRIVHASAAARTLWGAGGDELRGGAFASLFVFEVTSDDPEFVAAQWDIVRETTLDNPTTLETQPRGVAVSRAVSVRIEHGPDDGFVAIVQPPPAAPAAAPETGSGFSLLATQGAVGFFDLNLQTGRVVSSPAWKKQLGYVGDELPDTLEAWRELIHPDDSGAAPDRIGRKLTVGSRPFSVEFRMRHRLGHWVWIQCLGVQILSAAGQLERVVGLHLDISERKELEDASLAADERLELLGSVGPLGVFDLDFANQSFWFSPGWRKLLGYRDDEAADELATFAAAIPPEEQPGGVETWLLLRAPGQSAFIEPERLVGKDGRRVPVLFGAHRALTRKRDLARVTGFICAPAAGAFETEGALPAALVTETLGALAEGVLVTDAVGRVLHLNPTAVRLLGVAADDARGTPVGDRFHLVDRESGRTSDDPCERALAADQPLPLIATDALAPLIAGEAPRPIVWTARATFDDTGRPRGVIIVFRDPEEMSLTPEELVKANRFESLGLLAGGIAHDFNNLLTTILGGVSLAKDNHDPSALADSEKSCLTAKGLTRQLLAFAKGGTGTQSVIAAKEILDDAIKIAAAGSPVRVTVEVPEGVEPVRVDRAQILQVFQNLVVNAIQAMPPEPHRGQLQLTAANLALADDQVPPLPAGDYVAFEVRDNASGIAPENLAKIFDPFFTTKKHGTGLGLATVLSVVRKHGGQIGVDSTVGVGTAFTVYLPRADAPVEVQARRAPSLRFGTGRVLLMDDDAHISALTANMLTSLDYKYDLAKNGDEAIKLYQRYLNIGRPYDAVILDITVVGGMGGEECFKVLRTMDPEVRAIVSSGYDNDDMARRFMEMGFCGYLTKPYRVAELGKVIKAVVG